MMSPNRPAGGWEPAGWLSLKIILCRWSLIEKEFNNRNNDLILIRHRVCAQAAPGGLMVGTGVESVPCPGDTSRALGFAEAQEGDDGEVRHEHGDGSVCPGRAMVLVVSSASPCLGLGEDGVGKCGFVQPPQGRVGPHRVGLGGFCTPHIHTSRQRFCCGSGIWWV